MALPNPNELLLDVVKEVCGELGRNLPDKIACISSNEGRDRKVSIVDMAEGNWRQIRILATHAIDSDDLSRIMTKDFGEEPIFVRKVLGSNGMSHWTHWDFANDAPHRSNISRGFRSV